jgi:hypothetical protein
MKLREWSENVAFIPKDEYLVRRRFQQRRRDSSPTLG